MVRSGLMLAGALLLMLAAMTLKGALLTLPEPPSPSTISADRFDAHRAAERLARVLGDERPHAVDTPGNDAVRDRLIAEMRAVGLEPRIQDVFACNDFARRRAVGCARVRNLVATVGPAEGRHLLLSAHYDGTFAGPGAADAGIGIATLLETAHLLRGRQLERPVTFLFNEGEEMGLIGARAFERDPIAERIEALLNFEARGVTGPATMFETSRPNGPAIGRFARAVERPLANSLTTGLYRLIPNSTDVAVFEERDWTILNFAIIGNESRYHSAGDNLAALDRRSLQHMGDQAHALALDFLERPAPMAGGDRLYTDVLGRAFVSLPVTFGLVLLGLLLLALFVAALRRQALGRPAGAMVIALIGAGGVAWIGQALLSLVRSGDYWRGFPWVTELAVYGSAMSACLLALILVAPRARLGQLRAAFWLVFTLSGAAIAAVAAGAAIYFLLPPLVFVLAFLLGRRWPQAEQIGAVAAAALLFLSLGPALHLFEELMSNGPMWMFAPLGALILLPTMIELIPLVRRVPRSLVVAGAADLFLVPWIVVAFVPAYSEDRQQLFTIEYVWDADARSGRWAVNNDGAPVPFAAEWRREELPHSLRKRWVTSAPAIPLPEPAVEVVARRPAAEGGRRLTLRLRSGGAESLSLIAPPDAALRAAGTAGFVRLYGPGGEEDRYLLRCIGQSCDGALLELEIGRPEPVEMTLIGSRSGLPSAAAPLVAARPAFARPQYAPDTSLTVSRVRM